MDIEVHNRKFEVELDSAVVRSTPMNVLYRFVRCNCRTVKQGFKDEDLRVGQDMKELLKGEIRTGI